jgi:NADH-quinone oxidoreductase subunit N
LSAPLIWVVIPAAAGLLFWFFRQRRGLIAFLTALMCLLLALLAGVLPIGQMIQIGPLSFQVDPTLAFAGRRLVLNEADRTFLVLVYFLCAFWFAGSYAVSVTNLFIPFGLGMVALFVAAQAVEPFLYAALLVEMAVLLAVPMLAPPGKVFGQGVLRFLIFQTLAMPFILLAGWTLGGVEANPSNLGLVGLSAIFLSLGFAFWLAVFPFYTWIPLLSEQSFPYTSGFVFMVLPTVNLMIGLSFLDRFGWLRALPDVFFIIGQIGTLMIVTAGIWAAFQKDLARLFGYAVIVETGFSLVAVGLGSRIGNDLFSSMFLPRMIGLGLWALALSVLTRAAPSMRFEDVRGISQKMPFASIGLAVASLTLGGLPLLAMFPIRQVLMEELAARTFFSAVWVLIGTVGMLFSAFRALAVLSRGTSLLQTAGESRLQIALLVSGMAALLILGLFPQAFLPLFNGLLSSFTLLP